MYKTAKFINKWMLPLLVVFIITGLIFGYSFPDKSNKLQSFVPFILFVMLYPMMIGIKFSEVGNAFKRWKLLSIALILNFLISPILAAWLANSFLFQYPDFAIGLILTGTVPCGGMIIAYTGMAKGNAPFTLVVTTTSLFLAIIFIPIWMSILVNAYVAVLPLQMFKKIVILVVVPLILGNITRYYLIKKFNKETFQNLKPVLSAVSKIGMFCIFFISMASESVQIINHPEYLSIIGIPVIIFYIIITTIPLLYARISKMNYEDTVALFYSVGGKNISLALAVAVMFFNPRTVMIIAIKPLIQVIFMMGFLRFSPIIKEYWSEYVDDTDLVKKIY